jgi:hypothetical protein
VWPLIPDGSFYFWKSGALNLLDHFVISKGLYPPGLHGLAMDLGKVQMFKDGIKLEDSDIKNIDPLEMGVQ